MRTVHHLGSFIALALGISCGGIQEDPSLATGLEAEEVPAPAGRCYPMQDGHLVCVPPHQLPPPPPVPPAEVIQACAALGQSDPCAATLGPVRFRGRCAPAPDGRLGCVPEGAPGPGAAPRPPPPAALEACADHTPLSPCTPPAP